MRKITPKNLLIGSASIRWWFPEFREPRDYDIYAIDDSIIGDFIKKNPRCVVKRNVHRYIVKIPDLPKIEVTVHYRRSAIDQWVIANQSSAITEIGGVYLKVARPTTMLLIKRIHSSCGADTPKKKKNQEDLVFLESMVHEAPTDMEVKAYEDRLEHIKNIIKRR